MPVDKNDAVSALEGCVGWTNIHAGRMLAMLAHHGQRNLPASADVLDFNLADPLRIGCAGATRKPILIVAGSDAIVAAVLALLRIDQHSPADLAADGLSLAMGDIEKKKAGCN